MASKKKNKADTKTKAVISKDIIICPHCGAHFHPSEIFVSEYLLGKTDKIVKDPIGKILLTEYCTGEEPCVTESFECEQCSKPFVIEATISYKSKGVSEEEDFSNLKSSLL